MQTLSDQQLKAVEDCCDTTKRLVSVTGQAGTGKTTIIKQVYEQLVASGYRVAVAAPTGKAARRIREATGINAVTMHRLLEYPHPGEIDEETGKPQDATKPRRGKPTINNPDAIPLDEDVVIVDEYAMVSTELHRNLVNALHSGAALRVFGDLSQLPPIDDGHITLKDYETPFTRCLKMKNSHILSTVYRQAEGSDVLEAATSIRNGRMPARRENFKMTITDEPVKALQKIVKEYLEAGEHYGWIENQIITPSRKTWIGTNALNTTMQGLLNPYPKEVVELPRHKWEKGVLRVGLGDKIVCTQNCYDLRPWKERYGDFKSDGRPVYNTYIEPPDTKVMLNGETGILTAIRTDGSVEIDFGDRVVEVPSELEDFWLARRAYIKVDHRRVLDLAYVLTTHKCQGSEFDNIIYIMNKSTWFMANRKNFYTAVTRAKHKTHVITDQKALNRSVTNAGD